MKIAVFCYITNNKDKKPWPEITFKDDNITYFMFTDDVNEGETKRDGWNLIKVDTEREGMYKEDMNKLYKWHPYDNFKDYDFDYSLYIDSKVILLKNPNEIVCDMVNNMKYGFVMHQYYFSPKKYPEHKLNYESIYKHIDYLIDVNVGNLNELTEWRKKLKEEEYPEKNIVFETAIILTDLKNKKGKTIQDEIFRKYKEVNSRRDQVVVPYVLWKMGLSFSEFSGMGKYTGESKYAKNTGKTNINNRIYS